MQRNKRFRRPRRGVFQDPMQGAPMEVAPIPLAARPKMRYGLDYLPGTGYVKIQGPRTATPWRGGIFGQPPSPRGRQGIFKSYWALPPSMAYDDTGVFTPFQQRRIPGTCMDCGDPLEYAMGQTPEDDLVAVEQDIIAAAEEAQVRAKPWLKKLGEWMYGPPIEEDPRSIREIQRANEKKAWLRAGLILAAVWWYAK